MLTRGSWTPQIDPCDRTLDGAYLTREKSDLHVNSISRQAVLGFAVGPRL